MAYRGELTNLEQPSFGESILAGLGGAGQAAGQGLVDYYRMKEKKEKDAKTNKLLSEYTGMPPESFEGLSVDERRDFISQAHKQRGAEAIERLRGEGRQELQELKGNQPSNKDDLKLQERQAAINRSQSTINTLLDLVDRGNVGAQAYAQSYLPWANEAKESIGEFDSLIGGLESSLVEMVNKGTLSDARFKYITETLLPKSSDTVSTIKGKLKGLQEILINQFQEEGQEVSQKEMMKESEERTSFSPGEMTPEVFEKIWAEAKGDPEKAKKIAKKMGYKD